MSEIDMTETPETSAEKSAINLRTLVLKEGLVIAVATALGYGLSIMFECGYCAHFEIPTGLISVDLVRVFAMSAFAIIFLSGWSYWVITAVRWLALVPSNWRVEIGLPLLIAIAIWTIAWVSGSWSFFWLGVSISVLLFIFLVSATPLATWLSRGSHPMLFRVIQIKNSLGPESPAVQTFNAVSAGVVAVMFIFFLAMLAGTRHAQTRDTYLVLEREPSFALAATYGDKFILAEYDKSNILTGKLRIRTSDRIADDTLVLRKTGRLKRNRIRTDGSP